MTIKQQSIKLERIILGEPPIISKIEANQMVNEFIRRYPEMERAMDASSKFRRKKN